MYSLHKWEMDTLASGYSSLGMALVGLFGGASVTLWATFFSVPLPEPTASRIFLAALAATGLAAISGVKALNELLRARRVVRDVTIDVDVVNMEVQQQPQPH